MHGQQQLEPDWPSARNIPVLADSHQQCRAHSRVVLLSNTSLDNAAEVGQCLNIKSKKALSRRLITSQQLTLSIAIGETKTHTHQETIQLRFGKRTLAHLIQTFLYGNHKKELRQSVAGAIDTQATSRHGLHSAHWVRGLARLISSTNTPG